MTVLYVIAAIPACLAAPVVGWQLQLRVHAWRRARLERRIAELDQEDERLDQYIAGLELHTALVDCVQSAAFRRLVQARWWRLGRASRVLFEVSGVGWARNANDSDIRRYHLAALIDYD